MSEKSRENYTRITKVLENFSGLEKVPAHILEAAAERGRKVHLICEGIVSGIGEFGVDEETQGYVDSFYHWWGEGKPVIEIEKRFWCDEYQITGQIDMIIDTPEGLAIVDLKTSSRPSKTWEAQGSGYAYLAKSAGYDVKKVFFIHLKKDGKPAKIYEYSTDPIFFLTILRIYNHFWG